MEGLLNWLGIADAGLRQAATGGLFGFFGVLITGLIAIATWIGNRIVAGRERRRVREDRRRDLRWAFWSEIDAVWRQWIVAGDLASMVAAARARFQEDPNYLPFVTAETGVALFETFAPELPLLDGDEVAPIVAFYRQTRLIERFAQDLTRDGFAKLASDRRRAIFIHYLEAIDQARADAEACLHALEPRLLLAVERRLDRRRTHLISNRATGRTDQGGSGPASARGGVQDEAD